MLGKLFDKILHEDEEITKEEDGEGKRGRFEWRSLILPLGVFLLAVIPRLYFLFIVSDPQNAGPGWYSDTYHHWQIGYLSKTVGFKRGFLRLWDLKGMEYFWGILHPLGLVVLFTLTGSVDILVPRLLSVFCGSLSVVLLFLIVRRYFNFQAALASAILAALTPIGVFNDASGMQESLGIVLLLAGLYFWPRKNFLAGLLWALSGMVRAEFWLFSLGLVGAALILERNFDRKIGLILGYGLPTLFHMKILLDKTGNPIYPIWWNFLGNAVGKWQADIPPNPTQLFIQKIYWLIFALSLLGAIVTFIKKPKSYLFLLLGFGSWLMLGTFIGFTKYLLSYLPRFWVDRIMLWPYMFLGTLIALFLFWFVPRFLPLFGRLKIGWAFILVILVFSQLAWRPIWQYFGFTQKNWEGEKKLAKEIGQIYKGEGIALPPDRPPLTYALVRFESITGENIVGEMFDPFYYFEEDPFSNWSLFWPNFEDWLKKHNIRLLVFDSGNKNYQELVKRQSDDFAFIKKAGPLEIYEVLL